MAAIGVRRRGADQGAAVVEFALVTPLLLLMLFGIIEYGIWFADSISARQAARDVARGGSVEQFGSCSPAATGPDADLHNLACSVQSQLGQLSAAGYVRAVIAPDPLAVSTTATGAWQSGATLRVCVITQHRALLPLVPLPAGGITTTRVDIPIEVVGAGAATRASYQGPTPPSGANWTWCP
jgi:Flp pilus assembly protein TadG